MSNKKDRKRRSECFFGLHFDFHAKPAEVGEVIPVGGNTTPEMINEIIDIVKPDYIQIDCKGHPGWSSYPTENGNPYPNLEGNQLRVWREETAKRGVALFMHYSGVVDDFQCEEHPDWAAKCNEDQRYAEFLPKGITSTFGPYVDKVLVPQLLELAGEYGVDGVWLDGECWGTQVDYSDYVMSEFREKTGVDVSGNPPMKPGDDYWQDYSDFCREQFRIYMKKYVDTLHYIHPEFQIASNWAFSSKMPEPVSVNVDFLSGDYIWADSVNSARYEGRCLAPQGKPWDLMAWGFRWRNGDRMERCPKHPKQLMQEAAVVLALGGGFQSYYPQKKDGSVHMWQVRLMKEVARFCRDREEYCHKARQVPQVAVLNSTYERYHMSKFLFQCEGEDGALQGVVQLFCETGQSFEILSEHNLSGRMKDYSMIVVPETRILARDFADELVKYAEEGGSLLLIGTSPYEIFKSRFDLYGKFRSGEYLVSEDGETWAYNHGGIITDSFAGIPLGHISLLSDIDDGEKHVAAEISKIGKGMAGFILTDIGETYLGRKSHVHRNLMKKISKELYKPIAAIEGSMYIDMTVMEKDGAMMINLVNTAGSHDDPDVYTIDEIPPIGPVTVKVSLPKKPSKVRLYPSEADIKTEWDNRSKTLSVVIPQIGIHEILSIN